MYLMQSGFQNCNTLAILKLFSKLRKILYYFLSQSLKVIQLNKILHKFLYLEKFKKILQIFYRAAY